MTESVSHMADPSQRTTTAEPAPPATTGPEAPGKRERSASLWVDAGRELIRNPVFVISSLVIIVVSSMALFPTLWTDGDPRDCDIAMARVGPSADHPFGFSSLGCDYYAQAIYGARPSLLIALTATIGITVLGGLTGMLAGFFGRWADTIVSRVADIFFALPFLLGALVFLSILRNRNVWTIALVLVALGWPTVTRIMRGSVIAAKNLDYVQAARALGASNSRLMFRHILPNAVAATIVVATITLGAFVSAEATITFLGVGLQTPESISWGIMISQNQSYFAEYPWLLAFPCGLLVATVLSFILAGDALRDALDPKLR
ncbi:MAG TPA: ABC transporter permease [Pilimelia sp.]|nr:ABC transporter permease [Pilimelia sp.]